MPEQDIPGCEVVYLKGWEKWAILAGDKILVKSGVWRERYGRAWAWDEIAFASRGAAEECLALAMLAESAGGE